MTARCLYLRRSADSQRQIGQTDAVAGIETATVAAVVAVVGGVVAAVATILRLVWDSRDRKLQAAERQRATLQAAQAEEEERRPKLRTYDLSDMPDAPSYERPGSPGGYPSPPLQRRRSLVGPLLGACVILLVIGATLWWAMH